MTDEIYEHLCYDGPRAPSLVEVAPFLFERALMINGTSKAYAMTGWRIGYAVGPAQLIEVIVKMIGQSTTCASSVGQAAALVALTSDQTRSEEHTSELQSLMRISYAVFCLKKKTIKRTYHYRHHVL